MYFKFFFTKRSKKKEEKYINMLDKRVWYDEKVIQTAQRSVEMSQDSTFIFFSLEEDTVFVGKKFPPEGAKIEDGTLIATDTNIREHNAIREMVRSSIDSNRYSELKANNVWLSLNIYVDPTE
jgi:hypothetical protein